MIDYAVMPLPTPFPAGPINAYLIKADPLTLIDCGPYSIEARQALVEQLDSHGIKLEDIKRIIITHAHPDHFGLAAEIQRKSDASVYMHNKEVIKAQDRSNHLNRIVSYMIYAGMTEEPCRNLQVHFGNELDFVQPPEDISGFEDGHIFSFDGFELEAILTPGHSSGHISLHPKAAGLLFVGDTMLDNITPNPVIEPLPEIPLQREKSLLQYLNSLDVIQQLGVTRLLTGHGKPILDVSGAIKRMKMHHQKRTEQIRRISALYRVFKPYDLIIEMYPKLLRPVDYYLALSEILGHLDLLEDNGEVIREHTPTGLVYSRL